MKDIFKPEDFHEQKYLTYAGAANMANHKLKSLIESWPVVVQLEAKSNFGWYEERPHLHHNYKRQARLAFIEPIVKGPCKKHIPINKQYDDWGIEVVGTPICENCGIELVAEWRAK